MRRCHTIVNLREIPWGSPENPPSLCSNSVRGIPRGFFSSVTLGRGTKRDIFGESCVKAQHQRSSSISGILLLLQSTVCTIQWCNPTQQITKTTIQLTNRLLSGAYFSKITLFQTTVILYIRATDYKTTMKI